MKRGTDIQHATKRGILRKQVELLAEDSLRGNLVANSHEIAVLIHE